MINKYLFIVICFIISCNTAFSDVTPSNLFCDHMVVQRNVKIPVWGTAKPGEKVTVILNKAKKCTKADSKGKWKVILKKQLAGGPFTMSVKGKNLVKIKDVYVGDVYLCSGQSNMDMTVAKEDRYWCGVNNEAEEVANAKYPLIRLFDVDFTPNNVVQTDVKGLWEVCSPTTVGHFSAAAYFFAKEIFNEKEVPIGLITSAYGASTAESWISERALKSRPNLSYLLDNYKKKLDECPKSSDPMLDQHNPFVCYNGMIAPLIPFPICGALWYQGESNGPSSKNYREIMETLVSDWRTSWGLGAFPFIYVQLANYGKPMVKPVEDGPMMTVRESQSKNISIPNTAMICAIENAGDDPTNIHPKNKQEIGYRLSLAARALVYGENITYSGPTYRNYQVEGDAIRIFFDNTEEFIVAWNAKLTGFAICDTDKVYVWADAKFDGNTVLVSSPSIKNPVAVRYCWGTNPPASLANMEGLWTPHFRTDE